jgi:3-oxoacyl-[acyl-carrier protein] reductase
VNLNLSGKLVLISASTGGIGQAIAESFGREGARVIVNGRTSANVEKAIAQLRASTPNAEYLPLVADIGTAAGCATTLERFPTVDILVNNVGIYEPVGFFEESDGDWKRLIEINVMSGVRLSRHYLKGMLERNAGRIIFISSESGLNPAPEMAHYSVTKTAQLSLSRSLAELTRGTKVTVNSVLPGPTMTETIKTFLEGVFPGVPTPEAEKRFIKENRPGSLIARFIKPEEIADVVVFVSSDKASAINGSAIKVEGGIVKNIA